jgi:hypothetical protein
MPRNVALRSRRDEKIKADYAKMYEPKKYRTDYIISQLSEKYYLTERTIRAVLWGEYDKADDAKSQLSLF